MCVFISYLQPNSASNIHNVVVISTISIRSIQCRTLHSTFRFTVLFSVPFVESFFFGSVGMAVWFGGWFSLVFPIQYFPLLEPLVACWLCCLLELTVSKVKSKVASHPSPPPFATSRTYSSRLVYAYACARVCACFLCPSTACLYAVPLNCILFLCYSPSVCPPNYVRFR